MANLKIPWTCDMGDEEAWEFAARENALMMYPPAWLHGYLDACESVREDSLKERLKREQMGDENMEFKVGDRIRIINQSRSYLNGKIATITEIEENGTDHRPYYPYHVRVIDKPTEVIRLELYEMELVEEEKEMTGFEVLLKHWGLKVGEKFNIKEGGYNPYYFDKNMNLIDCDGDVSAVSPWGLVNGGLTIQKIEVKEMTMEEICKALGYDVKIKKEDK